MKQSDLPLDLELLFTEAMRAVIAGDLNKAWTHSRRFLESAREWDGSLAGQAVAAKVDELLDLLDNRLWTTHGEKWAEFTGTPAEDVPNLSTQRCAFCRKTPEQVVKLIAGPRFYACNECLTLCNEVLDD